MKTLKGMKYFSSLENKKLSNLNAITGGIAAATNDKCTTSTTAGSTPGGGDLATLVDGVLKTTMTW